MQSQEMNSLLRIFIGEDARFDGQPLYESIVLKAREQGLAGATVLRGPMGYGHSSLLRTAKILRLSGDLPVIVEVADTKEKICVGARGDGERRTCNSRGNSSRSLRPWRETDERCLA
jgi:uncharacterized protein